MPSNELTTQELSQQQQQDFQEAAEKLTLEELQQTILNMVKGYNECYETLTEKCALSEEMHELDSTTISSDDIATQISEIQALMESPNKTALFKKFNPNIESGLQGLLDLLQKMAVYQSTLDTWLATIESLSQTEDKKKPSNGLMLRGAVLGTVAAGALSLAAGSPSALLGAITATSGQFGIAGLLVTGLIGATAVVPALPLVLIGGAIIGLSITHKSFYWLS